MRKRKEGTENEKKCKKTHRGSVVLLYSGIVVRIAGGNKKEEEYETRPTVAVENPKTEISLCIPI